MRHMTHGDLVKVKGQQTTGRSQFLLIPLHVGLGDLPQGSWLGSRHLYPLSHLASPLIELLKMRFQNIFFFFLRQSLAG